jgi:hypothetical protein
MTTTPPPSGRGATTGRASTASLPRSADRHTATRRRWRIARLRGVSQALDWLICGAPDPWQYVKPVGDYYRDGGLDRLAYRDHAGRVQTSRRSP